MPTIGSTPRPAYVYDAQTDTWVPVGVTPHTHTSAISDVTGLQDALSGPTFKAFRSTSAQSITANTYTKLQFNAEEWDSDNAFDSVTNSRFTPTKAGYYQLNTYILCTGSLNAECNLQFRKNGTNVALLALDNMGPQLYKTMGGGSLVYFNGSTDYVEVFIYVGAGTPLVYEGANNSYFTGVWIRS